LASYVSRPRQSRAEVGGAGRVLNRGSTTRRLANAFRWLVHLLARPVRATTGQGPVIVQPYRGYGSREEIFLIGRVFQQPVLGAGRGGVGRDLLDLVRRFLRWGLAEAALIARFCGTEQRIVTDRDGYFRVHLRPERPPPPERLWHRVELELLEPARVAAEGELFVPPSSCRYVVISDIDDTVVQTGVANKVLMLWRLFMQGARSRTAFPGMAALLQALHDGRSGHEVNPMLYVSRAPWGIYEVMEEFFRLHRIPIGPILFLREWGLTLQNPLPRRAPDHKLELIRNMLALYRDLPFVLIGDSGQRDPEIYAQLVREHPGRVLAIYVRNVSRDAMRHRAIGELAAQVVDAGSSLLLAADSLAMAEHAAELGLISADARARVLAELADSPQRAGPEYGRARRAGSKGELQDALAVDSGDQAPRSVILEADRRED
jgi:phosphatidate phosphatase APP1